MRRILVYLSVLLLGLGAGPLTAQGLSRIKDITSYRNVRRVPLVGYGLVVGLNGTGDRAIGNRGTVFTVQSIANMLEEFGITINSDHLRTRNVAAVMVTASSPPYGKPGTIFDVNVASLGDASSLENGVLLMTPLQDPRHGYYGIAQGPVSVGGFNVTTLGGERLRRNYALVGRVPNGAVLERTIQGVALQPDQPVSLLLKEPNYTTATRIAEVINTQYPAPQPLAQTMDAGLVEITYPPGLTELWELAQFVASIEVLEVVKDVEARVVINERTGTVVAGGRVTIGEVLVSHGSLQIHTTTAPYVVQPSAFSLGQTITVPVTRTTVTEQAGEAAVLSAATVAELAAALNDMGLKPRDIIAVFQAIKEAGALNAKLIIM
ncbi:MAG: flagellar basal body P-ring protein FlgI [Candidatus Marinimicrobia bacterium]|nr:flagellar basal body P-ring protein FlgI [Candidatus Neomarinimicrobiota bacterium]